MTCDRPPADWYCPRDRGHAGPCPAVPRRTPRVLLSPGRARRSRRVRAWAWLSQPVRIPLGLWFAMNAVIGLIIAAIAG